MGTIALLVACSLLTGFLVGRSSGGRTDPASESASEDKPRQVRVRERDSSREAASPRSGRTLLAEIRRSPSDKLGSLMFRAIECSDPIEKELLMAECLMFMDASNWSDLLRAFADATGTTGKDQYGAWKHCLMRSGQVAGQDAMDHWRKTGFIGRSDEPWHTIYGWASVDPDAARQWLRNAETEGEGISSALYQALIAGSALHDSGKTMALLESLPEARRNSAAGHLVWNLTARGGLDELKPWLEYARKHADHPELANLAGGLRGEIEKKFIWAGTNSGRPDLALQHLDFLATGPADLPALADRMLSGFGAAKSSGGLDLVEGLLRNPRFAGLPEMGMLENRALEQAFEHNPATLDTWLRANPNASLAESIRTFRQQHEVPGD